MVYDRLLFCFLDIHLLIVDIPQRTVRCSACHNWTALACRPQAFRPGWANQKSPHKTENRSQRGPTSFEVPCTPRAMIPESPRMTEARIPIGLTTDWIRHLFCQRYKTRSGARATDQDGAFLCRTFPPCPSASFDLAFTKGSFNAPHRTLHLARYSIRRYLICFVLVIIWITMRWGEKNGLMDQSFLIFKIWVDIWGKISENIMGNLGSNT